MSWNVSLNDSGLVPLIRRSFWLLLARSVLAGIAGYTATSRQAPTYEASLR